MKMGDFVYIIILIGTMLISCGNAFNQPEQKISEAPEGVQGSIFVFCNQQINIQLSEDAPSPKMIRSNFTDRNKLSYSIQKPIRGEISRGKVTVDQDTMRFVSEKGKRFEANLSREKDRMKLNFPSAIETDEGMTESIGSIEEGVLFKTEEETDLNYLLNLSGNAFEIGYKADNGTITFLDFKVISAGPSQEFGKMMSSIGSHGFIYYECPLIDDESETITILTKKITNWVPPYSGSIVDETFHVANGDTVDTRGILNGSITSEIEYRKISTSNQKIERLSMLGYTRIYKTDEDAEFPYLRASGSNPYEIGKMNEENVVSFILNSTVGSNAHDIQTIVKIDSSNYIFVAYDFVDFRRKAVSVFIRKDKLTGPNPETQYYPISNDLDTRILNNTVSDYYYNYTYNLLTVPLEWKEVYY